MNNNKSMKFFPAFPTHKYIYSTTFTDTYVHTPISVHHGKSMGKGDFSVAPSHKCRHPNIDLRSALSTLSKAAPCHPSSLRRLILFARTLS